MKRHFKFFSVCIIMLLLFNLTSCYNGKLCYADNSVTQTNNIDVSFIGLEQKAFAFGVDSESRIAKYGEFGELTQINIKVSGSTTLEDLGRTTTGIDSDGNATNDINRTSYFTDLIKIKIRLPKNYALVNTLNGRGNVQIDKPKQVEDDYFKVNLEWVRLNKEKTMASLVVDDGEEDRYLFFEFLDAGGNVLSHYFVKISYDVQIV